MLAAAFAAGAVNALAGGGTFVVFPVLVMSGVAPIMANATSSAVTLPGGLVSAWVHWKGSPTAPQLLGPLMAASVAGGASGSLLLLFTPASRFAGLVPYLMLGAALVFTFSAQLRTFASAHTAGKPHTALLMVGQFFISIYGGYFGAGMGVLMITLYLIAANINVQASGGLRMFCATAINALAVLIFAVRGIVNWRLAIPMLLAAIAGGYLGARVVQRLNVEAVRRAVLVFAWATGVWLLVRSWQ